MESLEGLTCKLYLTFSFQKCYFWRELMEIEFSFLRFNLFKIYIYICKNLVQNFLIQIGILIFYINIQKMHNSSKIYIKIYLIEILIFLVYHKL